MYLKLPAGEGKFTIIPLTDENVYSICPVCGEEHQVDITKPADLVMDAVTDYVTLQVCCPYCTGKVINEGLDAALKEHNERLQNSLRLGKWIDDHK